MNDPTRNFLQEYLDAADSVHVEVREKNPETLHLLDECVNKIGEQTINWGELGSVAQALAFQSQSVYMSSIRTAISGHPSAIFSGLRTALECACYALLIAQGGADAEAIWGGRHDDADSLKQHKKTFGPAVALAAVEVGKYQLDVQEYINALYETCIDYGAHPNPRGFGAHVQKDRGETESEFDFVSLYRFGRKVDTGMLFCVEIGIGVIWLLAAATKNNRLLTPPSKYLNDLMERKCACADRIAGQPIKYGKSMYNKIDPDQSTL